MSDVATANSLRANSSVLSRLLNVSSDGDDVTVGGGKSVRRIWFGQVKILLNSFSPEEM